MKSSVLLLAAFLLKVLVSSPGGQAQTTDFACEGASLQLSCSDGNTLSILNATYGRTSSPYSLCPCSNCRTDCRANTSLVTVRAFCQGSQQCSVEASNNVFGGDPCPGVEKYLEVSHRCIIATDPIDHFQPRRQTAFPTTVVRVTTNGTSTVDSCAESCLVSPSCLAFQWPRGVSFSNTCHLYREVGEPIADSTSDLYFKILPTPPATQPTTTRGYTTEAKYVPTDDKVGPGVLAGVAIATAVVGFILGVGVSQLVQWRRSKPEGESSRQADLEGENSTAVRLIPVPLPRPDQTGTVRVHYDDVPTENAPHFLRQTSGQYQELRPAEYQGLEHGDENEEEEEYVEPIAREDSTPYEAVDDTYLELQP